MTGLGVYSTEYDPQRLYATGDPPEDRSLVEVVTQTSDEPLSLVLAGERDRILWTFQADRQTRTTRTGAFVADCGATDGNLFETFKTELRRLHGADDWTLPKYDALRYNAGFELDDIEPGWCDLAPRKQDRLLEYIEDRSQTVPVVFGMESYRAALTVLRALYDSDSAVTVAVGSTRHGAAADGSAIDVVLCPDAASNFVPLSRPAERITGSRRPQYEATPNAATGAARNGTPTTRSDPNPDADRQGGHSTSDRPRSMGRFISPALETRIAGIALVVVLGFSLYSFVSPALFHPITGLAAIGSFAGTVAAAPLSYVNGADQHRSYADAIVATFTGEVDHGLSFVALGTILGYLFPTVLRISGDVVYGTQWLFGTVDTPLNASLSVAVYVGGLSLVALGVTAIVSDQNRSGGQSPGHPSRPFLRRVGIGATVYAVALAASTGLAGPLWYGVVPAV